MKKNGRFRQGKFVCRNREKYRGNCDNIFYRSGLEMRVFRMLDSNPNVLEWNSEETIIPYQNPLTGRVSRYFVDVYAKIKTKTGEIKKFLIEIKPYSQTLPPNQKQRNMKTLRYQQMEYVKNQAKWQSASSFCSKRDMNFVLLTEKHLNF